MPLYKITTPEGSLSSEAKAALAAEITEFHSQMSGLDEAYTKIVFNSFLPGDGFIGREAGPAVILTLKVRAGRPADYRKKLLFGLRSMLQRATGAADARQVARPRRRLGHREDLRAQPGRRAASGQRHAGAGCVIGRVAQVFDPRCVTVVSSGPSRRLPSRWPRRITAGHKVFRERARRDSNPQPSDP
jgi:phenylpyruvate tautomerase PptA (4-oxalocrotonate tautomerase family)